MCKIKNLFPALLVLFFAISSPASADVNQDLINKVSFGRAADVELLLQQKADPNTANAAGITALFLATGRSDDEAPKIVQALIRAGADIYRPNADGNLPIIDAVKRGNPLTVKTLIENKSLMSVKDNQGKDLWTLATERANNEIITYVRAGIEAEQSKLATLKSDENFIKQVQKLSFLSCTEYYLVYFKRENPAKLGDEKYQSLLAKNKEDTDFVKNQLTSLFDMTGKDISGIVTSSKKETSDKLDSLLTPENRVYNGFGTNAHLNKTCKTIAERWNGKNLSKK